MFLIGGIALKEGLNFLNSISLWVTYYYYFLVL